MTTRIFFRLSEDANNEHSLWTGAITGDNINTKAQARSAVAKHLRVERLPSRTLVLTQDEWQSGQWTADEVRGATSALSSAPTVKRKKKAFSDIGMTFDQAEDLLKKFGLK